MSILNQDTLDVASTTFRAVADELFERGVPGLYPAFTDVIPTGSKVNEIDILETMPVIRQWLGSKEYQSIRASKASATVVPWEKSFEIPRLDLAADKTGLIGRRIRAFMTQDGGQIYDKICTDFLVLNTGVGYDGVVLFSSAHPRGPSGNQSNTTTSAFSFAQHDAIMQAGASLVDQNSEPFGIAYDTLMVGPKLMKLAMEVTQSSDRIEAVDNAGNDSGTRVAAAGVTNVYGAGSMLFGGGVMDLIINPRLVGTYDDYYYYLDTRRGPKPVLLYEFRKPEAIDQMTMESEVRFTLDKFRMSVECDVIPAAGAWQTAYAGIL